ncbi:MAG: hypothetical protein J2P24_05930 [Streptosporangiales bacterium]|nr:hypothetical protein [Streptosporangiales bacterium]MBO0890642.1 hypothetical protein [Acidothermales bacterium]
MRSGARVRQVLNAVNLSTVAGLAVGRLGGARFTAGPDGLLLGSGYRLGFPVARAFTVGDAVIGTERLGAGGPLLRHEARHATQYAALGLLVPPLYALAAAWSWLLTGDWWSQNPFERLAGLADGAYTEHPVRPWWRRRPR